MTCSTDGYSCISHTRWICKYSNTEFKVCLQYHEREEEGIPLTERTVDSFAKAVNMVKFRCTCRGKPDNKPRDFCMGLPGNSSQGSDVTRASGEAVLDYCDFMTRRLRWERQLEAQRASRSLHDALLYITPPDVMLPESSLVLVTDSLLGEQGFPEDVAKFLKKRLRGVLTADDGSGRSITQATILPFSYNLAPLIEQRVQVASGYTPSTLSGPPASVSPAVELPADGSAPIELAAAPFLDPTELEAAPGPSSYYPITYWPGELSAGTIDTRRSGPTSENPTGPKGRLRKLFHKLKERHASDD